MSTLVKADHTHYNQSFIEFVNSMVNSQLKHYASDLFPELEMIDEYRFNHGIERAQQVCVTLNLPLHAHFKKVYRTSGTHIYCDYRLSHTAYLLVGINGDVGSKKVAQIQMEMVKKLLGNI